MLNLTSFLDFYQREVVMSSANSEASAQAVNVAGRTVSGLQRISTLPDALDDRKRIQVSAIGTTKIAKEHAARREECPPEVYIG